MLHGIFSVPIVVQKVKEHEKIKSYLVENTRPDFEESGHNTSTCMMYTDLWGQGKKVDWPFLHNYYVPQVQQLMEETNFDMKIPWRYNINSWYNWTKYAGWQELHDHVVGPISYAWCGVHYVVFDKEKHEPTRFWNPNADQIQAHWPSNQVKDNPPYCQDTYYSPEVNEGDIVWFPPWLKHQALQQMTDSPRLTVAINLTLVDHPLVNFNE